MRQQDINNPLIAPAELYTVDRQTRGSGPITKYGPDPVFSRRRQATMDEDLSANAVVEAGWQVVRDDGRVRAELLEAAYAEPRLRQLFPWTGMGELHFSRCTEPRWTWDVPFVQPAGGGTYSVSGPDRTQTVGLAATAREASAMVVERLPSGSGPAFVGTPEELAAHEAKTR
jgi:hypothetical protein